jgi:hypothetical protein
MVQFSLTTRALAVVPSCFRPISQHSFQRIELVALKTAQLDIYCTSGSALSPFISPTFEKSRAVNPN